MSKKSKKIIHFREQCIGCNSCTEYAPGNWKISGLDGKATLQQAKEHHNGTFVANIPDVDVDANLLAARDCPVGIIHVVDEDGKEMAV